MTKSTGNRDLVTFTEEILNSKLHFLSNDYCPVRILPNLSKVYEWCMYIQIYKQNSLKIEMCLLPRLWFTTLPSRYGRKMETVSRQRRNEWSLA